MTDPTTNAPQLPGCIGLRFMVAADADGTLHEHYDVFSLDGCDITREEFAAVLRATVVVDLEPDPDIDPTPGRGVRHGRRGLWRAPRSVRQAPVEIDLDSDGAFTMRRTGETGTPIPPLADDERRRAERPKP